MRFICRCTSKIDSARPLTEEIFKTFDAVVLDDDGFLICFVHRERRQGWRSVPYAVGFILPNADPAWSPLEYERWLYWGEIPKPKLVTITSTPGVPDIRDNRDPEQVGKEYLAAMAVARNGNEIQDQTWTPAGGPNTEWQ